MLSLAVFQNTDAVETSSGNAIPAATSTSSLQATVETPGAGQRESLAGSDVAATAAVGMLIVFVVLVMITLFIQSLPRLLQVIAPFLPEARERPAPVDPSVSLLPDEQILAAIGYVLHTEIQRHGVPDDSA